MSSVHEWDDNRIFFKEASSLAKQYQVDLHALGGLGFWQKNGVDVYGLPRVKKRYLRPVIWWRLWRRALKTGAAVYHLHDPELIPLGLLLKVLGRKVIYDVHEDYSDTILHKQWIPRWARKIALIIFNIWEKKCASLFDALVFADSSIEEKFHKVDALKENIVNYPLLFMHASRLVREHHQRINLIYAGTISEIRGAVQMVEALSLVVKDTENVHLYLVGPVSPGLKNKLEQMFIDLRLQNHITMTGRVTPSEVYHYYASADIALALLHPVENYYKSLVTKLFEYMSAGLPIVTADFPRWKAFIEDVGAGLTVNPLDPEAIAWKIKYLIDNPGLRLLMGQKGRSAFEDKFNWGSEEKKLLDLYNKLLGEKACEG